MANSKDAIVVTKKLSLNTVHTLKNIQAEKSSDGRFLIITGTSEENLPAQVMSFIGHDVSRKVAFNAIMGQLGLYGSYKTVNDCVKAINEAKDTELQVQIIEETYTDAGSLQEKVGLRTLFDPDDFQ